MNSTSVQAPADISVYVHLPWCVKKCPYCDFNSHALKDELPEAQYAAAIASDIENQSARVGDRAVRSVFFGGGTPSLFSGNSIGSIIDLLDKHIGLAAGAEITLEANPGTAEAGRFRDFKIAGVNRLSIGVQSFFDDSLERVGRIHDGADALAAIDMARAAGFDNFNIDLMYALPGQSPAMAIADIRTALACEPTHLSCYQLTIEPNTLFFSKPPELPEEQSAWQMSCDATAELQAAGFANYEVSAWSKPERQSLHNTNYWTFGDYLGVGAGAHGKLTLDGGIYRTLNSKHPTRYMQDMDNASQVAEPRPVEADSVAFEFMLNALRLSEGFEIARFEQTTGLPLSSIQRTLDEASNKNLLIQTQERIQASELGRRFLNDLTGMFL